MFHALNYRWLHLCDQLKIPSAEQSWAILVAHYQAKGRHYHTLSHVGHCLGTFDKYRHLAQQPTLVEFALWMHDIIYNPRRNDNEALSANMAALWLDHDVQAARKIKGLIGATAHHSEPRTPDQMLVVDIDLGVLGAPRSEYVEYAAKIRQEFAWVPDFEFKVGREKVLRQFLDRPSVFNLSQFAFSLEAQARANIEYEVACLGESAVSADQREKGCP